jgi:hypothetical protein
MSAIFYNPAVRQRVVLITNEGSVFSTASTANKVGRTDRGVDLDQLLKDGWQIVSVTPTSRESGVLFILVLGSGGLELGSRCLHERSVAQPDC